MSDMTTAQRKAQSAAPFVPAEPRDLEQLRSGAAGCRGCRIADLGTHTVFGEGAADARVVLVGEQPGDVEDQRGRPFVGPAGVLLDRALAEAGLDRDAAYVTNAVKHFKFTMAGPGRRRIHAKPDAYEQAACKPWLAAELTVLSPEVVVLLGATAAQTLFGPSFRISRDRGVWRPLPLPRRPGEVDPGDVAVDAGDVALDAGSGRAAKPALVRRHALAVATWHPSAILRADDERKAEQYAELVGDLAAVAGRLAAPQRDDSPGRT